MGGQDRTAVGVCLAAARSACSPVPSLSCRAPRRSRMANELRGSTDAAVDSPRQTVTHSESQSVECPDAANHAFACRWCSALLQQRRARSG